MGVLSQLPFCAPLASILLFLPVNNDIWVMYIVCKDGSRLSHVEHTSILAFIFVVFVRHQYENKEISSLGILEFYTDYPCLLKIVLISYIIQAHNKQSHYYNFTRSSFSNDLSKTQDNQTWIQSVKALQLLRIIQRRPPRSPILDK